MKKKISLIGFVIFSGMFSFGANANTDKNEALKETVALILNLKGNLCATVTEIIPLQIKNQYEVTCIAYRGGKATKTYVFNAADGTAFEQ
ncbi:MAG: hypothetical protein DYH15_12155 [Nitrosomonas sp. PRO4]|nr:hypothetical protein [Nitrosomonas sp. PRO4]